MTVRLTYVLDASGYAETGSGFLRCGFAASKLWGAGIIICITRPHNSPRTVYRLIRRMVIRSF
jgi:hypothetical protein